MHRERVRPESVCEKEGNHESRQMCTRSLIISISPAYLLLTSCELLPWFCGECVKSPVDDHRFALLKLLCGGPFDLAVGDLSNNRITLWRKILVTCMTKLSLCSQDSIYLKFNEILPSRSPISTFKYQTIWQAQATTRFIALLPITARIVNCLTPIRSFSLLFFFFFLYSRPIQGGRSYARAYVHVF